jgi:hypothetical protein
MVLRSVPRDDHPARFRKNAFNFSGIVGMGIGLSNAYYPLKSVSAGEIESGVATSLVSSALGNLLPEFWPDFSRDDEVWVEVAE